VLFLQSVIGADPHREMRRPSRRPERWREN
jgi:hypothetical protein